MLLINYAIAPSLVHHVLPKMEINTQYEIFEFISQLQLVLTRDYKTE